MKPDNPATKRLADMLPERPAGVGRPIDDRAAWKKLARLDSFKETVRQAEALAREPIPDQPDALYLDYSRTGTRINWERVASKRRARARVFALAECVENRGRFVKPLEEFIEVLCKERTWVMPAHDRTLANFRGVTVDIDLASAALGWELATTGYLLGARLGAATRSLIRTNVRKRVLDPFLAMIEGRREKNYWLEIENNWNAVCLAGVVGTALAVAESREERARFICAGLKLSKNFLRGFGADGYCSEGLAYWNYGFGHYALMAETVLQATGGALDMLKGEDVRRAAMFGAKIEIANGVYPAFADCHVDVKPKSKLMSYVSRRYGLGLSRFEKEAPCAGGPLFDCVLHSFPNSVSGRKPARGKPAKLPSRAWFDKSGVLICRPGPARSCRMGVALKGGNNAEHHNHNDVGSFVVVAGETPVLLDPGPEVYTARTFSANRYASSMLNSYGHPVPVVAGKLQSTGMKACGKVVGRKFTNTADRILFDISSAYAVKALRKLSRTFLYSRAGAGSLTVTDEVEFSRPKPFSTALITLGRWKRVGADRFSVSAGRESLLVQVEANGLEFEIGSVEINEDMPAKTKPTRIEIRLKAPVRKARVTVKMG